MSEKANTGVKDVNGNPIFVGDIIMDYGSLYLVCQNPVGEFYLALVSDLNHSCHDIPYSFNSVNKYKVQTIEDKK